MPMFEDQTAPPSEVVIEPSAVIELDWAMSAAHPGRAEPAQLAEFYAARPDLAERVRDLWSADEQLSYPGYPELSIVAYGSGLLFGTDPRPLLERLDDLRLDPPGPGGLAAETPEDRVRIQRRLERLRTSAAARRRYAAVVRELWAELEPLWEAEGRPAVESALDTLRAAMRADPSWEPVTACEPEYATPVQSLLADLPPGSVVAVVPAFFARKGLVIDLPGVVLVGVRAEPVEATSRQRAEDLARRLKAISEPTRLALVETLARRPMTVSELAGRFSLAQPTVSNHVKLLRDAGLVASRGDSRRKELVVRRESVADLLSELERFVAGPAATDDRPPEPTG